MMIPLCLFDTFPLLVSGLGFSLLFITVSSQRENTSTEQWDGDDGTLNLLARVCACVRPGGGRGWGGEGAQQADENMKNKRFIPVNSPVHKIVKKH